MDRHPEFSFNIALGERLRTLNPRWIDAIVVEQTDVFLETRQRPDLFLVDSLPIVIETEFAPARTVESDAIARLGLTIKHSGREVEQVIACCIPEWVRTTNRPLHEAASIVQYQYCVIAGSQHAYSRWPTEGWIEGSITDLADCLETVRVSEKLVSESAELLENTVLEATNLVIATSGKNHAILQRLGNLLNQEPSEQTVRMAMTILANAFTFYTSIQYAHDLPDFTALKNGGSNILLTSLLDCWRHILRNINYWPIFEIAIAILLCLGSPLATQIFGKLEKVAVQLSILGASTIHDLSGRILQRLITDRKFLATFYTLPSSAALLADLSLSRLPVDFSNKEECTRLRIADFACGTGTLLTAAYQVVLRKFRRQQGNDAQLHSNMMGNALIAADIMPAATHLTASQLSSTNPAETFDKTCVYTMPYGQQSEQYGRHLSIGSLDLIAEQDTAYVLGTGSMEISGTKQTSEIHEVFIKPESLDVVIMNPPFTRPTNHESTHVPIPSFAGFQTSVEEQRAMASKLKAIRRKLNFPVGNGYAGLASDFIDLAHVKLKPNGGSRLCYPQRSYKDHLGKKLENSYSSTIPMWSSSHSRGPTQHRELSALIRESLKY